LPTSTLHLSDLSTCCQTPHPFRHGGARPFLACGLAFRLVRSEVVGDRSTDTQSSFHDVSYPETPASVAICPPAFYTTETLLCWRFLALSTQNGAEKCGLTSPLRGALTPTLRGLRRIVPLLMVRPLIHHSPRFLRNRRRHHLSMRTLPFETYNNYSYFQNKEARRRRMLACVEAVASLRLLVVCCIGFRLERLGEIGKLVSEIGHIEKANQSSTSTSDPSFIVRCHYTLDVSFTRGRSADTGQQLAAGACWVRGERTGTPSIAIRTTRRGGMEERSEDREMSQDSMGAR